MNGPLTKLGIVRCRDLVQLYYGGRMVTFTKNTQFSDVSGLTQLVAQDMRRIRYEIYIADGIGAGGSVCILGTKAQANNGSGLWLAVANIGTLQIVRDFTTDLEAVTEEQWINFESGAFTVSVYETFLTPLPVDESP